ncbi:MAG: diguanylate cyclase [Deltaproteobacteria bacterium]|nr:diguanylate cyclase [Deltaproteobacteria bacterium]
MASDVQDLINNIVRTLLEDGRDEEHFFSRTYDLAQRRGGLFYRALLHVLTHLDFPEKEAHEHWNRITDHMADMSRKLNRPVSFRVALIDYFFTINRKIENPKIIEIALFEAIERLTYIDPLTGLYNRRFLDQVILREISLANRLKSPFSIILFDLDFFKTYNDTFGHIAGDEALRFIANRLKDTLRVEDLAIRYGGEEFLVVLPRTSRSGALVIGERFRKLIACLDPNNPDCHLKSPLTLSGGIATFPQDGHDENQLLLNADRSLYQAKSEGRNTICFCTPDRRQFVRIDFICPIRYQVVEPTFNTTDSADTRNLSMGGLLFAVQQQIPLHAIVEVQVRVPESDHTVSFFGEVVRVENGVVPDGPYLVGLSFLQFEGEGQNFIIEYVKEKLKIE